MTPGPSVNLSQDASFCTKHNDSFWIRQRQEVLVEIGDRILQIFYSSSNPIFQVTE